MRLIDADALMKVIGSVPYPNNLTVGAVKVAVDLAQTIETPHWIPVTERLPKMNELVLVCFVDDAITLDGKRHRVLSVRECRRYTWDFDFIEGISDDDAEWEWEWLFSEDLIRCIEVKCWTPLPEPPKSHDEV